MPGLFDTGTHVEEMAQGFFNDLGHLQRCRLKCRPLQHVADKRLNAEIAGRDVRDAIRARGSPLAPGRCRVPPRPPVGPRRRGSHRAPGCLRAARFALGALERCLYDGSIPGTGPRRRDKTGPTRRPGGNQVGDRGCAQYLGRARRHPHLRRESQRRAAQCGTQFLNSDTSHERIFKHNPPPLANA